MSASSAKQGHWNDPDMLQIGNGVLTEEEEKTHFALWAVAKAPLIIGTDLSKISDSSKKILQNKNLISINQDFLHEQVTCRSGCDPANPSSLHVYQGLVMRTEEEGLY